MANEFEIEAYRKERELLVLMRGRLVLSCCQDAKTRLTNLLSPQTDVLYLYLAELGFLDSAGLGVMVGIKMTANKNRMRLMLLSPPQRIQDIFRVSKLDTIFEIRNGAEADVIAAAMKQPEFCIWCDRKDDRQGQYNTEADFMPKTAAAPKVEGDGVNCESKVRQLCDDAVEYICQGDYTRAIENYERALAMDQDNLSALNNIGIVYEKKPEWYANAVATWKRVLELSERENHEKHASRARKHLDTLNKLMQPN